jgi:peptidyl-tRNA hydrolase, PTH1 family
LKLIVGLGNPGIRYQFSRHNMGFLVLDRFATHYDISVNTKGFDAHWGKGKIGDIPVYLAKPQTYMNVSGSAVKKLLEYFKIDIEDLIVIHDDLDLPFKTIRLKSGGGHAGHKGLISIINHLSNTEFIRVRIGIGKPSDKTMVERYVLDPLTENEMKLLPDITMTASDAITIIINDGIQSAMNQCNERLPNQLNKEADTPSL